MMVIHSSNTREDGVANPEIFSLHVDDYDKVWVGTYGGGVGVFDGETWNTLDKRDGIVDNDISALTSFGNNLYWFGSGFGVQGIVNTDRLSRQALQL